jgi:hypothetical protein
MIPPMEIPPAMKRFLFFPGLLLALLVSPMSQADPGDFGAMPGLWKIVTRLINHGVAGPPKVQWHCVDEGADPWASFATLSVPDHPQCDLDDKHRGSTTLAWTLSCSGKPATTGKGRVSFDSAEHYTASVSLKDLGEVMRVEGKRYAACTSPSD